ncbi:MAG: hypothetical protein DHS20C19_10990 [Acidimicrobiales bacterium]|nr:MAG: hypothetical protein DHS20C19_10990 [Acidimicrobiales bacterium]
MATSTSAGPTPDDEFEIEILDAFGEAGSEAGDGPGNGDRTIVEAEAGEDPLSVWIDDLRESVDDVLEPARRASEQTGVVVGSFVHRLGLRRKQRIADSSPRRQSRLRLHLFIPYAVAQSRIPAPGVIGRSRGGRLLLDEPFEDHRAGVRAPGTLVLRGSWPGLPVWIAIEPWWRRQTIVTMSLRSTNRMRYPRRYFASSYRTLRTFVATLSRT